MTHEERRMLQRAYDAGAALHDVCLGLSERIGALEAEVQALKAARKPTLTLKEQRRETH